MKMREYFDAFHGPGEWDRMHECIERKEILGWDMPMLMVDGHEVRIFPGTDREATVEAVTAEIRKAFAQHPLPEGAKPITRVQ